DTDDATRTSDTARTKSGSLGASTDAGSLGTSTDAGSVDAAALAVAGAHGHAARRVGPARYGGAQGCSGEADGACGLHLAGQQPGAGRPGSLRDAERDGLATGQPAVLRRASPPERAPCRRLGHGARTDVEHDPQRQWLGTVHARLAFARARHAGAGGDD